MASRECRSSMRGLSLYDICKLSRFLKSKIYRYAKKSKDRLRDPDCNLWDDTTSPSTLTYLYLVIIACFWSCGVSCLTIHARFKLKFCRQEFLSNAVYPICPQFWRYFLTPPPSPYLCRCPIWKPPSRGRSRRLSGIVRRSRSMCVRLLGVLPLYVGATSRQGICMLCINQAYLSEECAAFVVLLLLEGIWRKCKRQTQVTESVAVSSTFVSYTFWQHWKLKRALQF